MITYYEFMVRNLAGCLMHPDTLASIEKVHYAVEHNLPLKRMVNYYNLIYYIVTLRSCSRVI